MFDVNSPDELFVHINSAMENYSSGKSRKISELFFLIMSLNHLREWIAPGYNPIIRKSANCREYVWPPSDDDAKKFSKRIYEDGDFETLRFLCNGTKHFTQKVSTGAAYGLNIDDWGRANDPADFDKGPPSDFYVGDLNVEILIRRVISYYSDNWFLLK